ncbi:MAG: hypothetical protein J5776_04075 [Clostridiales bacterium]|nr:hypothetical protein [Clostridiales bacterium]
MFSSKYRLAGLFIIAALLTGCGSTDVPPETAPSEETFEETTVTTVTEETTNTTAAENLPAEPELPIPSISLSEIYDPEKFPEDAIATIGNSSSEEDENVVFVNDSGDSGSGGVGDGKEEELFIYYIEVG